MGGAKGPADQEQVVESLSDDLRQQKVDNSAIMPLSAYAR